MSRDATHELDQIATRWKGRAVQGASFCAFVPAAAGGGGTTAHFLPVAVLLAAFTAAGVWMFRRWGGEPATTPTELAPEAERRAALPALPVAGS